MKGSCIHGSADGGYVDAAGLTRSECGSVGITGGALSGDEGGKEVQEESDGGNKVKHFGLL